MWSSCGNFKYYHKFTSRYLCDYINRCKWLYRHNFSYDYSTSYSGIIKHYTRYITKLCTGLRWCGHSECKWRYSGLYLYNRRFIRRIHQFNRCDYACVCECGLYGYDYRCRRLYNNRYI